MKKISTLVILLLVVLLAACGTPPATAPAAEPTQVAAQPTAVPPTAIPATEIPTAVPTVGPAVGGTFVYALRYDPTTLDFRNAGDGASETIGNFIGAALVGRDPITGDFIPWLATEWTISEDGLTWTFKLREDVKFHNGTPLTAADYAWTLNRVINPDDPSYMAVLLEGMANAEAADDYTLVIHMNYPNFGLLLGLTATNLQPVSQAYVEAQGENYDRNPIGVGPYIFKEWATAEKVVVERNPDYTWGPEWTGGHAPYIQTIEFRVIPEYATRIAGLEAGEIDFTDLEIPDLPLFEGSEQVKILSRQSAGMQNVIFMNIEKEPFTDLRVRQAFNYAINKDGFIQLMAEGYGEPEYGPLASTTRGYWSGVEEIGYSYDLEKATSLMAEAGWTDSDGDGILDKDGQPLKLDILTNADYFGKLATVFQDQMKQLGVDITIQNLDVGALFEQVDPGNYYLTTSSFGYEDSSLMFFSFHSSMINLFNTGRVNDPDLDSILNAMNQSVTVEQNVQAGNDAQKLIVENAYVITTFAPTVFNGLSARIKGDVYYNNGMLYLDNAYLEEQ
jgi:peptide/nickel transport system substrate-binding protein